MQIVLSFALAAGAMAGTTYYVDSSGGNDGNSGTSSDAPWKTLGKVSGRTFQPGDQILFKAGGSWTGKLDLNGSGTEGNPIVVNRYGSGDKPFINGGGHLAAIVLENVAYWEVNNLEIVNNGGPTLSGSADYRAGVLVKAAWGSIYHHIYLKNLSIHHIFPETGAEAHAIHVTAQGAAETFFDDLRVQDCHIWLTGRYGITVRRDSVDSVDPAFQYNRNIVLKGNWFENTGGSAMQTSRGDGVTVEDNLVETSGASVDWRQWGRGSGYWCYYCKNVVVQHNQLIGARGIYDSCGAHIDSGNTNVTVQYNYMRDNEGGFAEILGGCVNSVYRYNISVNDGSRVAGVNGAGEDGYLVFVSDYMGQGNTRVGATNTKIYNNTIYVKSGITSNIKIYWRSDFTWVKNNIFVLWDDTLGDVAGSGTSFMNNLWHGVSPTGVPISAHDVIAAPQLVDAGGWSPYDYALNSASSPAVGTGEVISGKGGFDYFGNPVPVSPPCIGAHQTPIHLSWKVSDGDWDTSTWNWWDQDGGQYSPYFERAHVTFDDSAWGGSPIWVTLTANRVPLSVTAANNDTTYILTGSGITGTTKLTKSSGGTLILANNNYYSGWTDILGGTLQVGNGGTSGSLGTGSVVNEATLNFNRSDNFSFGNGVSGPGELIKWGAGTLTMQGNRSYTGRTVINQGTLSISGPNQIGYAPTSFDADNITLNNNAVLRMTDSCSFSNPNRGWTIWSGGGVIETAGGTSSEIVGVITGSGRLTKKGDGNLTFKTANTYSGQTLVTEGLLYLGSSSATFGNTTGNTRITGGGVRINGSSSTWERFDLDPPDTSSNCLQVGGGGTWTLYGAVTLSSDAAVTVDGNALLELAGSVYGPGGLTKNGYGHLRLEGHKAYEGQTVVNRGLVLLEDAAATLGNSTGSTRITRGAVRRNGTSSLDEPFYLDPPDTSQDCLQAGGIGTWTISGTVTLSSDAAVTADGGSTLVLARGVIGTGGLIKRGYGTLRLNGNNTYAGATVIEKYQLALGPSASLPNSPVITVQAGAIFDVSELSGGFTLGASQTLNGVGTADGDIAVNGTLAPGTSAGQGTLTVTGDITLDGTVFIRADAADLTAAQIVCQGDAGYGGELVVSNISASALSAGQEFQLFTVSGARELNFSRVTIQGAGADDVGAVFDPATGRLILSSAPPLQILNLQIAEGACILQGINGRPASSYTILSTTNLFIPFTEWTTNATGVFGESGTFSNSIPMTGEPRRFFRISRP